MTENAESNIPITIELNEALSPLTQGRGIKGFERHLTAKLNGLLKQLGLSGQPVVSVQSVTSKRGIRIRVHGSLQPYDPNLLKRLWLVMAPPDLRSLAGENSGGNGFPDQWLKTYVAGLSGSKSDSGLVFDYLARVVIEVISERPACLVNSSQALAYARGLEISAATDRSDFQASSVVTPLRTLLDMGISVAQRETIRQALIVGQQLGRSASDVVESIFTQLRSANIGIHVHPDYLNKCLNRNVPVMEDNARQVGAVRKFIGKVISTLSQQASGNDSFPVYSERVDDSIQAVFRQTESELFTDLGLQLPELAWVPTPQIPDGFIAIKINERLSPPSQGLQPGEFLVRLSLEQLAQLQAPRRLAAIAGGEYAIVSAADGATLNSGDIVASSLAQVVSLVLKDEVRKHAARLVGVEDLEYQLAQLRSSFPALVRTATACFSVPEMTRVFRGLVAEGVSIRNSRAILDGMLCFDTVTLPFNDFMPFDERLEVPAANESQTSKWRNLIEFVRSTLKDFIGFSFSQSKNVMKVYLLDSGVQNRAELAARTDHRIDDNSWLTEAEQEALRDSAWAKIAAANSGYPILTTSNARAPLRDLLAAEIPDLAVISYFELASEMQLEPADTISFDTSAPESASTAAEVSI